MEFVVGGASTEFHVLSAESRKYFRNAIPISGSAQNPFALSSATDHLQLAYQLAEKLGKTVDTFDELVAFLKNVPAEALNEYAIIDFAHFTMFRIVFAPIVERMEQLFDQLTQQF